MEKMKDNIYSERMVGLEENLKVVLNPMEPTIMRIQSLLVWENPFKSTLMIIVVHCIFWFFVYGGCSLYTAISIIMMMLYFLWTWKKKIWPEIKVPSKSPDIDDWTPVHPHLTSVPELCQHLAWTWCYFTECLQYWANMRRDKPLKFCVETSFICASLSLVGVYISGVMLSYFIILSIMLWPCLQYHSLLKKIYMKFEPVFMKLDYSMKVNNRWRYKGNRAEVTTTENTDEEGHLTSSVCVDNESDLEDFYPTDPMLSAALARAITDSEDEGGSPTSPLTPRHLEGNSDNDNYSNDSVDDFVPSISMMPSFEDALDHTDDELQDEFSLDRQAKLRNSEDVMKFVPSHFDNSDEEDTVTQDFDQPKSRYCHGKTLENQQKAKTPNVSENVMALVINDMVGSAIQNSVVDTWQSWMEKMDPNVNQSCNDRVASTGVDTDDDGSVLTGDSVDDGAFKDRKYSEDSFDIEEEFEFLDDYDLESDDKNV